MSHLANIFGGSSDEDNDYQQNKPKKQKQDQKQKPEGQPKPPNNGGRKKPKKDQQEKDQRKIDMSQAKIGRFDKKKKKRGEEQMNQNELMMQTLAQNNGIENQLQEEIKQQSQQHSGIHGKKEFSILKELKDDENFKAFFSKYDKLKLQSNQEEPILKIDKEKYYGNIEYKLKLVNCNLERIQHLTTQMKFRLEEGFLKEGQQVAYYMVGVEDDGKALGLNVEEQMQESLGTLFFMARNLNAEMTILEVKQGIEGPFAKVQVKRNEIEGLKIDIKITMLGGEGSGKSTLIGVLISGIKDNGRGLARTNVFRHKHEIMDGRTSSVSQQILGFDSHGRVTNRTKLGVHTWAQIVEQSQKILTFIDVAGNEKYAKTMIRGICCHYPDYALIMVDAKAGLNQTTLDHFNLAAAFNVPLIVIINKIDLVKQDQLMDIKEEIRMLVKQLTQKIIVDIDSEVNAVLCSRTIQDESICPLFLVSNKTGAGLDLFKVFLNLLPINNNSQLWQKNQNESPEFHITETFGKDGDYILSGMMVSGSIALRQQLLLGPDNDGRFRKVEIKGIHCKRVPVRQVKAGQMCSFAINLGTFAQKWIKSQGGEIRKGMVLLDTKQKPKSTYTFVAELWTFDGTTKTIKNNYQPVVHSQHIRQAARIIIDNKNSPDSSTQKCFSSLDDHNKSNPTSSEEEKERKSPTLNIRNQGKQGYFSQSTSPKSFQGKSQEIKLTQCKPDQQQIEEIEICSNKKTRVTFQFLYYPEYLNKDSYLIINENNLKALGRITEVYYDIINKVGTVQTGKNKRKNSVPTKKFEGILTNEEEKKQLSSYEDSILQGNALDRTRNRRVAQSHSMCIEETQEELRQWVDIEETKETEIKNEQLKQSKFANGKKGEAQVQTKKQKLSDQ